jgi:hypothetical protein
MEYFKFSIKKAKALYYPLFWRRFILFAILVIISYLPHFINISHPSKIFVFAMLAFGLIFMFLLLAFLYNLLWIFQSLRMYSTFYITVQGNEILYYCEQGHRFMTKCVCRIDNIMKMENKNTYIKLYADIDINYADTRYGHYGKANSIKIPKVFDDFDSFVEIVNQKINGSK